jgi:hypothetical protein
MSKNQRKKHKKNKIKKNKSIEKPSLDNRTTVQVAINKSISDKKESMGMKNLLGKIRQYAKSLTILFLSLLTIGFPIYLLYAYINEIESPNGLLSVLAMLVGFFIIYIFFLLFSGEITKESLYRTFVLFRERSPRLPQLICAKIRTDSSALSPESSHQHALRLLCKSWKPGDQSGGDYQSETRCLKH